MRAEPARTNYVAPLDGIRAIAIGAVFLLHLDRRHFPGGAFGVDVFFVLSAYLITRLLLSELDQTGSLRFAAFYWRRVFRLGPALVVWLLLVATPTAIAGHATGDALAWSFVGVVFYVSDFLQAWTTHVAWFAQTWSLAVEEQFYLVWPGLLWLAVNGLDVARRRLAASLFAVTAIVLMLVAPAHFAPTGAYFLPTGHLVALSLGSLAAFVGDDLPAWVRGLLLRSLCPLLCGGVFAAATFLTPPASVPNLLNLAVAIAAAALILHCALAPTSLASKALASAVPRWIGERSYGIYLYGLTLIGTVAFVTHLRLRLAAPVDLVVTAIVVAVSYRYIEAPLRARGRRWLRERELARAERTRDLAVAAKPAA